MDAMKQVLKIVLKTCLTLAGLILAAACQTGLNQADLSTQVAATLFAQQTQADRHDAPLPSSVPEDEPTMTTTLRPPTPTRAELPTATPEPTQTAIPYALALTPLPQGLQPISAGNVSALTRLANWGEGVAYSFSLSADGQTLAVGSWQGVHIYEMRTLSQIRFYPMTGVIAVALSPDGSLVASARKGDQGDIKGSITDIQSAVQSEFETDECAQPTMLRFSPDGKTLAGTNGEALRTTWEIEHPDMSWFSNCDYAFESIQYVALSQDGSHLAAILPDGLSVWDQAEDEVFHQPGIEYEFDAAAISYDGSLVAASSIDAGLVIWQVDGGNEIARLTPEQLVPSQPDVEGYMGRRLSLLSFIPNSREILFVSGEHELRLWNWETGSLDTLLRDFHVNYIEVDPGGRQLWMMESGALAFWEIGSAQPPTTLAGFQGKVAGLAFTSENEEFVELHANGVALTRAVQDGRISWSDEVIKDADFRVLSPGGEMAAFWDYAPATAVTLVGVPGGNQATIDLSKLQHRYSDVTASTYVNSVALSPDGSLVAVAPQFGEIQVWDLHSGSLTAFMANTEEFNFRFLTFSPDNHWLAGVSTDGYICLWTVASAELSKSFAGPPGSINGMIFTDDASRLVVAADETLTVWGLGDEGKLVEIKLSSAIDTSGVPDGFDPTPRGIALSQDQNVLFSLHAQGLAAWTLDGKLIQLFDLGYKDRWGLDGIPYWAYEYYYQGQLALSPDGSLLAWPTVNGVVEVWGVKSP